MECRFCGGDPNPFFALPLPYQTGSMFSCIPCGIEQGFYCEKHDKPHVHFLPENTGCLRCIEELTQENKSRAEEIYDQVNKAFPKEEIERIEEWAESIKAFTKDNTATCIVRSIATQAVTQKTDFEKVLKAILEIRSADCIVPFPF